jgi:hypothetical protein
MINKIALFVLITIAAITAKAQTNEQKITRRPDIPGTFVVEFGLNRDIEAPSNFSLFLWGSRATNIYYQYDIRILQSRMSFVPGFGLSLERFAFKRQRTIGYDDNGDVRLFNYTTSSPTPGIKKSMLVTNYVSVPLELRYSTKPEDPSRSFKAGVGFRVGYMYDSFSKVKYREDGETKVLKDKQNFNLNRFRYGVFAKVGGGNFAVFGHYNLTNLFEDGKGPYIGDVVQDFQTYTIGISLSSF